MVIKSRFDHANINVTNIDKSVDFYKKALGLEVVKQKKADDGSFILTYLSAPGQSDIRLELTWLRNHPQHYELGENESHLCYRVEGNYEEVKRYHKENGWICFENKEMGLYFINDPDDYWIEILPAAD